ncbi:hypothetical protein M404DRAFT_993890, partial [Pisolithus tinctorius Marx 270]
MSFSLNYAYPATISAWSGCIAHHAFLRSAGAITKKRGGLEGVAMFSFVATVWDVCLDRASSFQPL